MDREKYKTLIAYVCYKACEIGSPLNKTKLFKTIWCADIDFFIKEGKTITGDKIVRAPYGPITEKAQEILDETVASGMVKENHVRFFGGDGREFSYFCESPPNIGKHLTPEEVSVIDLSIDIIASKTASQISEMTHGLDAWKNKGPWETIEPVEFLVQKTPLTKEGEEWARKQIEA